MAYPESVPRIKNKQKIEQFVVLPAECLVRCVMFRYEAIKYIRPVRYTCIWYSIQNPNILSDIIMHKT